MPNSLKHDLRTPLNHIIGYCELLLEEAEDMAQPGLTADLERIHHAGRRLLNVINDLFDPVKSVAYKSDPHMVDHEIRTPLNQIIGYAEMLQEEARERGAEAFVADTGKILMAARDLLRLVIEKFGNPEMALGAAENPTASSATVFLRRDEVAAAPAAPPRNRPAPKTQGGSVLVVDDDEGNRAMLSRRLVRLGHEVKVAENGRLALAAVREGSFDLVLLDLEMPELNGYEVLEQLKADPALRDIPVIVLSASDETERVVRCIEMGAEDYLPKPFDPILLQARIGASLEKKRLRDREVSFSRQIQEEKKRSEDLLHIILPHDVVAELKATNSVEPRRFENVGVLFCDIVSFTAYCDQHSPQEVHTHLQALIEAFEKIIAAQGLEKIKTIGDAFMATAGLPTASKNPALDCVRCGLQMIAVAQAMPPHWQIRVGVHVGPLVAGVIGRRKYQYDIWGDTVNIAARMMASAPPSSLFVTTETWQSLATHCDGSPQGLAQIKGKGEMQLHSVSRVRAAKK